jgi:HD superfamily phosphohydrolase YqeK
VSAPPALITLPDWAQATEARRAHIARVVELVDQWARALAVTAADALAWRDSARWHDALRDAPEETLRRITGVTQGPIELLHGPAASSMLEQSGERRRDVLDAIRFHTIGSTNWSRTGRALFMADFLDPGRDFDRAGRSGLAARVPSAFDEVFRDVVRQRIEWAMRDRRALFDETVALWNAIR